MYFAEVVTTLIIVSVLIVMGVAMFKVLSDSAENMKESNSELLGGLPEDSRILVEAPDLWDEVDALLSEYFISNPTADSLSLVEETGDSGEVKWVLPDGSYVETDSPLKLTLKGSWDYWTLTFNLGDEEYTLDCFKDTIYETTD